MGTKLRRGCFAQSFAFGFSTGICLITLVLISHICFTLVVRLIFKILDFMSEGRDNQTGNNRLNRLFLISTLIQYFLRKTVSIYSSKSSKNAQSSFNHPIALVVFVCFCLPSFFGQDHEEVCQYNKNVICHLFDDVVR